MNEWTDEKLAELPVRDHVRQRGLAATRLEAFCDAAFAFSVTILVISTGGVPGSYAELLAALRDVPAFAASFAAIAGFWAAHRMWSQRYGLEDRTSTFLSLAMVFVMLIYVYPLKMVFGALASWMSGGALPAKFSIASREELVGLFVIYGLGFAAQSAMLGLLYAHALRVPELRLSALERLRTRHKIESYVVMGATGLVSALYAAVMPGWMGVWAGFIYATLPITMPIQASRQLRQVERSGAAGGSGS
ncbi:MAG: DUF1211 domain-containing protein [bacterium]|nr:DUF1211 domain-containing protein [bacterium]